MKGPASKTLGMVDEVLTVEGYRLWGAASGASLVYSVGHLDPRLVASDLSGRRETVIVAGLVEHVAVDPESDWIIYVLTLPNGRQFVEAYNINSDERVRILGVDRRSITGLAWNQGVGAVSISYRNSTEVKVFTVGSFSIDVGIKLDGHIIVESINRDYIIGVTASGEGRTELGIIPINGGRLSRVTASPGNTNKMPKARDGVVSFVSGRITEEIYILDLESMTASPASQGYRDYSGDRIYEVIDYGWADDRLWVIGRGSRGIMVYLDGKRILEPGKGIGTPRRGAWVKGKLVIEHSTVANPPSLALTEVNNTKAKTPRNIRGGSVVTGLAKARSSMIYVESGSLRIPVFKAEPPNTHSPAPTILYIHGGPWDRVEDSWNPYIALLLQLGFRVIAPNYRGSMGEGLHFASLSLGDPGGGDLDDVLAVARWARSRGLASELHLLGIGYGGYLALLAASREKRLFETVAAISPIVDWEDIESSDHEAAVTVNTLFSGSHELMKSRSLLNTGYSIEAPVLIIQHGRGHHRKSEKILEYVGRLLGEGARVELHLLPTGYPTIGRGLLQTLLTLAMFLSRGDWLR